MKLATVNKALSARFPDTGLELVRGDDYFYFIGAGMERCKTASVYVPRLNDLSLERWLEEADGKMAEVREHLDASTAFDAEPARFKLAAKPTV